MSFELLHADCRYWLARRTDDGTGIELVDGCHGSPEGVAQAAKLHGRIFNHSGPWLMVELHPLPDMDVPINEDAARDCAYLIAEGVPALASHQRCEGE